MRRLTIKRSKAFLSCMISVAVYIEDPEHGNLNLGGIAYRELGKLKNGKSASFEISENAANILVEGSSAPYAIPAGGEDVFLQGRMRSAGMAAAQFVFDGQSPAGGAVVNPAASQRSDRITKTVIICAVLLGIGFTLYMVFHKEPPKEFTMDGFSVTLDSGFEENSEEDGAAYHGKDYSVFVLRDPFIYISTAAIMTVRDYAESFIEYNSVVCDGLKEKDGLLYCETEQYFELYKRTTYYVTFFYKGDTDFWVVDFATDQPGAFRDEIFERAASVKVKSGER